VPPGTIFVEVAAPPAVTNRALTWATALAEMSAPSATAPNVRHNRLPNVIADSLMITAF
jgi:hypothetical protein